MTSHMPADQSPLPSFQLSQGLEKVIPPVGIPSLHYYQPIKQLKQLTAEASNNQHYQILIVEDSDSDPSSTDIKTILETETQGNFKQKKYQIAKYNPKTKSWEGGHTIGDTLPTLGAKPDQDFIKRLGIYSEDESKCLSPLSLAEYSTVRFFLQTRRVSQLVAKTWLPSSMLHNDWERLKIKCTRDLILSNDLEPDSYLPKDTNNHNSKQQYDFQYLKDIGVNPETSYYLIQPGRLNFNGIRLGLLLAGQAYIKVDTKNEKIGDGGIGYMSIGDSILSTYETVYEYAWKVSWDTFYASRVDLARPGSDPAPPYYEVTLAYPPKPAVNCGNPLTDKKIEEWGFAHETDSKFPFYPKEKDGTYSIGLENIVPPYPYIPMSCAC